MGAAVASVTLAWPLGSARADDAAALALAVKAAFLYKFEPFVTWPARAFPAPDSPFTLCVLGDDPFGDLLDRAVNGQQTAGRRIVVVRLKTMTPGTYCHLLYISGGDAAAAQRAEAALAAEPTLTVTDSIVDASAKGMINFVIADNRVRFEIDDAAAKRTGLQISSKLLSLAVAVKAAP
jgi:hypothetical protein